jgi:hypothetical protein
MAFVVLRVLVYNGAASNLMRSASDAKAPSDLLFFNYGLRVDTIGYAPTDVNALSTATP